MHKNKCKMPHIVWSRSSTGQNKKDKNYKFFHRLERGSEMLIQIATEMSSER